jgi:tRNA(fMet)-specific endonuclease VapC
MSPRYLLDTDTCIFFRRKNPPPSLVGRLEKLESGEIGISVITFGELAYGVAKSSEPERALSVLERLIERIPVLTLPESAGRIYGEQRAALEVKGMMIGSNDLWIAAHAVAADLVLVTNNEREFRRVNDLKIENWAK